MRLQLLLALVVAATSAFFGAACGSTQGGPQGSAMGGAGSGAGGNASAGSGCLQRELFNNGNFDAGDGGWTASSSKWPGLIVTADAAASSVMPQSGAYLARLGGYAQATADDTLIASV